MALIQSGGNEFLCNKRKWSREKEIYEHMQIQMDRMDRPYSTAICLWQMVDVASVIEVSIQLHFIRIDQKQQRQQQ